MVKTPVFFTSLEATSARRSNILEQTAFLSSFSVANASANAPLVIARTAAFIAGAMSFNGDGRLARNQLR